VRHALLKLSSLGVIFCGQDVTDILTPGTFLTSYVSDIEREEDPSHPRCVSILRSLGVRAATASDAGRVRHACRLVSTRAAGLCAAGLCAIVGRIRRGGRPHRGGHGGGGGGGHGGAGGARRLVTTVGVDGSVYRHHPT
ncbi:hexokinase-4-like, partial [Lampetra fluviatilis]